MLGKIFSKEKLSTTHTYNFVRIKLAFQLLHHKYTNNNTIKITKT